jgi:hypothetical protein
LQDCGASPEEAVDPAADDVGGSGTELVDAGGDDGLDGRAEVVGLATGLEAVPLWAAWALGDFPAGLGVLLDRSTVAVMMASATSASTAATSASRRRQYTDGD